MSIRHHIASFIRCPTGYVLNLVASCTYRWLTLPQYVGMKLSAARKRRCLRDGIQDDPLF